MKLCSVDGCEQSSHCKGMCDRHYRRARRGVPPEGARWPERTLEERFWEKVDKRGPDECWPWLAGRMSRNYGAFGIGRRNQLAHRVSYELAHGPIPDGLVVDHLCMNPPCVNPAHLEAVTVAENTRRGYSGPIGAAFHRAKTHCPQGHPYSPENTYLAKGGTNRLCRTCRREKAARARRSAA